MYVCMYIYIHLYQNNHIYKYMNTFLRTQVCTYVHQYLYKFEYTHSCSRHFPLLVCLRGCWQYLRVRLHTWPQQTGSAPQALLRPGPLAHPACPSHPRKLTTLQRRDMVPLAPCVSKCVCRCCCSPGCVDSAPQGG